MSSNALEMLTEIIQGTVAVTLVAVLGAVSIIDALTGRPFTEPATIASLAGAAVGFYYGQRGVRRQQETIRDMATTIATNGGAKSQEERSAAVQRPGDV